MEDFSITEKEIITECGKSTYIASKDFSEIQHQALKSLLKKGLLEQTRTFSTLKDTYVLKNGESSPICSYEEIPDLYQLTYEGKELEEQIKMINNYNISVVDTKYSALPSELKIKKDESRTWPYSLGMILLTICLFFIPSILKGPAKISWMKLGMSPNEIGDAIGGMTAPFIGIAAAWLVYISFRAQIKANTQLMELNEKTLFFDAFENYKSYFKDIEDKMEQLKLEVRSLAHNQSYIVTNNLTGASTIECFNELNYKNYDSTYINYYLTQLSKNISDLYNLLYRFYKLDPKAKYRHTIPYIIKPDYKKAFGTFCSFSNEYFTKLDEGNYNKTLYSIAINKTTEIIKLLDQQPIEKKSFQFYSRTFLKRFFKRF